jgi:hypothetical protein
MTQKERLAKAAMMAIQIKGVAQSLRYDARDFDCKFPIAHAERLEEIANEYLRIK